MIPLHLMESPKLDKLIFRVIEDPSSRLLALQAKEIHGMEYPDPASFDLIEADDDLHLVHDQSFCRRWLRHQSSPLRLLQQYRT